MPAVDRFSSGRAARRSFFEIGVSPSSFSSVDDSSDSSPSFVSSPSALTSVSVFGVRETWLTKSARSGTASCPGSPSWTWRCLRR